MGAVQVGADGPCRDAACILRRGHRGVGTSARGPADLISVTFTVTQRLAEGLTGYVRRLLELTDVPPLYKTEAAVALGNARAGSVCPG